MLNMCDKTFILTDKVEFVPDEEMKRNYGLILMPVLLCTIKHWSIVFTVKI